MRRVDRAFSVLGGVLLVYLAACGGKALVSGPSDPTPDPTMVSTPGEPPISPRTESGPAGQTPPNGPTSPESNGQCCPPSSAPGCCMDYGGWSSRGGDGGCPVNVVCDDIPDPGYPGWEKRKDDHGCEIWYAPPDAPASCGVPEGGFGAGLDSGVDSGSNPVDAGAD